MPVTPRTPRAASRAVLAVVAIALVATSLAPAPAMAQAVDRLSEADRRRQATLDRAPRAPRSPDDPFAALRDARTERDALALARLSATAASNRANLEAIAAAVARQEATEARDEAEGRRDRARAVKDAEEARMSQIIVGAFVNGGETGLEIYEDLLAGDDIALMAGQSVMFEHILDRQEVVLDAAKEVLTRRRVELAAARAVLKDAIAHDENKRAIAERLLMARRTVEADHNVAAMETEAARQDLRAAGRRGAGPVPANTPIVGLPRLSAEDLSSWFAGTPYRPRVSTPIADYARWFIEEGNIEGIRGDIAFAQAILETGGFANDDTVHRNNFSGIGHCDTCDAGFHFPSPQMGVRAQIQLLKSYAVGGSLFVNPLVDRRLRGPAGCCATWEDLTGTWATDPDYHPKFMALYTDMVNHALRRRANGQGLADPPLG